jgi:hypothetical protein
LAELELVEGFFPATECVEGGVVQFFEGLIQRRVM